MSEVKSLKNVLRYKNHLKYVEESKLNEFKALPKEQQKILANIWGTTHNGKAHGSSVFNFDDKDNVINEIDINYDGKIDYVDTYKQDENGEYKKTIENYDNIESFMTSVGLSVEKPNDNQVINQAIKNLKNQGIKQVTIAGKIYNLALHSKTREVDYSSSDNPMLILATNTSIYPAFGQVRGSKFDDIIIASNYPYVSAGKGNDYIDSTYNAFTEGNEGNDHIHSKHSRYTYGDAGDDTITVLENYFVDPGKGDDILIYNEYSIHDRFKVIQKSFLSF